MKTAKDLERETNMKPPVCPKPVKVPGTMNQGGMMSSRMSQVELNQFRSVGSPTNSPTPMDYLPEREQLSGARRIVVKVSTKVISRSCDGRLALSRIGILVEQLDALVRSGRDVILVTSGAVISGQQRMRREQILNSSPLQLQSLSEDASPSRDTSRRAAAACGQSALMSLYDLLFSHMDLGVSQLLVTHKDFKNPEFTKGLKHTVDHLLSIKNVPVVNWNDATENMPENASAPGRTSGCREFLDNNELALVLAETLQADLLVLLSDIDGLTTVSGEHVPAYVPEWHQQKLDMSCDRCGSAYCTGMSSKVQCAWGAAQKGIRALIANGKGCRPILLEAVAGHNVGTLFDAEVAAKFAQHA